MVRVEDMKGNSVWVNSSFVLAIADVMDGSGKILIGCCSLSMMGGAQIAVREGKDSLAMRIYRMDMVKVEEGGNPH